MKRIFSSLASRISSGVANNSQTIFAIAATAGVVFTAVSAAEAGIKATKLLDEYIEENQEPDCEFVPTKMEVAKVVAPAFFRPVISGGLTIGSIWLSWRCHNLKLGNAMLGVNALGQLYSSTRNDFKEYRDKNVELYGDENDSRIREEVTRKRFEEGRAFVSEKYGNKVFKVYEPVLKNTFYLDLITIFNAEKDLNEIFQKMGKATMYDLYVSLGQKPPATAKDYRWSKEDDGYAWIDISKTLYSDYSANDCCDLGYSVGPFEEEV